MERRSGEEKRRRHISAVIKRNFGVLLAHCRQSAVYFCDKIKRPGRLLIRYRREKQLTLSCAFEKATRCTKERIKFSTRNKQIIGSARHPLALEGVYYSIKKFFLLLYQSICLFLLSLSFSP